MRERLNRRVVVVVVATALFAVLGAGSAIGIVFGEPDQGEHPHVGSIVVFVPEFLPDGEDLLAQWCTGTRMEGHGGSDVFLTAAHCLVGLDPAPVPGLEVLVTFDEVIEPTSNFYTGTIHTHPDFGTHGMADLFDVAVIVLDNAPDVGFGELPEAGLLDAMKKSGELRDETFTAVGYGAVRETRRGAFDSILDNAQRNKADQHALSLTKAWLTLSMNEATGNGGTCYGDSGGPHFIKGTNTVVSLTVTGDTVCKATDKTYRLDTAAARDFLAQFMPLP